MNHIPCSSIEVIPAPFSAPLAIGEALNRAMTQEGNYHATDIEPR
ncbi:hypothetical protein [Rhodoflexus sp.]